MGFARQVLLTYGLRLVLLPAGLANAILIARYLGPEGQGTFSAVTTYVGIAGILAGLGLGAAATRAAAMRPGGAQALAANARISGSLLGIAGAAGLGVLRLLAPDAFDRVPIGVLLLGAVALPFNLAASQLQGILLGLGRIRPFNAVEVLDRLLLLTGSVVLLAGFGLGVRELVAATALFAIVRLATLHALLGTRGFRLAGDAGLLRETAIVSSRAYAATILSFLVLRSDIALIQGMLGTAATGVYAVAVQITDLLLVLPGAVGSLLFPRVAAGGSASNPAFTAKVCRLAAAATASGCLAAAVAAGLGIVPVFGEPYHDAIRCVWVLLPGVLCVALQGILANDLAGRDYPVFIPAMWIALLAVNVGLNVALLPRLGIVAAAWSSTIAYAGSLAAMAAYWLRRFPGIGLGGLFVLRRDDLIEVAASLRRAVAARPRESGA